MAITERYVTAAATGGGDGSEGSPWTLAEGLANVAKNERLNIKADSTYNVTSAIDFTNSGDTDEPIWIRGYSSAIGDGGKPVLSCTSGGRIACSASHVHYSDFRINGSPHRGRRCLSSVRARLRFSMLTWMVRIRRPVTF
jgi:hypothetical protein